jgi:hypothetical protein
MAFNPAIHDANTGAYHNAHDSRNNSYTPQPNSSTNNNSYAEHSHRQASADYETFKQQSDSNQNQVQPTGAAPASAVAEVQLVWADDEFCMVRVMASIRGFKILLLMRFVMDSVL